MKKNKKNPPLASRTSYSASKKNKRPRISAQTPTQTTGPPPSTPLSSSPSSSTIPSTSTLPIPLQPSSLSSSSSKPVHSPIPPLTQHMKLLLESALRTFSVPANTPQREEGLRTLEKVVDLMVPELMGVHPPLDRPSNDFSFSHTRVSLSSSYERPAIRYQHVYGKDTDLCSIGIFFLPAGSEIPLHDHPHMTVLSKLLYGKVHMVSYDWVSDMQVEFNGTQPRIVTAIPLYFFSNTPPLLDVVGRPAKLVCNHIAEGPTHLNTLFPDHGGNLHQFRALTDCAILDILGPPYNHHEDRTCTYYTNVGPLPLSAYQAAGFNLPSTAPSEAQFNWSFSSIHITDQSPDHPSEEGYAMTTPDSLSFGLVYVLAATEPPRELFGKRRRS